MVFSGNGFLLPPTLAEVEIKLQGKFAHRREEYTSETPLAPSEKLDALKFLSETHRSLHDQRRRSETRAFFTTLTFFALVGAARFTGQASLPNSFPCWLLVALWVLLAVLAVASCMYLCVLHSANQVNKGIAEDAEKVIRRILEENAAGIAEPCAATKLTGKRPLIWQIVAIVVFAVAAGFFLGSHNVETSETGEPSHAPEPAAKPVTSGQSSPPAR